MWPGKLLYRLALQDRQDLLDYLLGISGAIHNMVRSLLIESLTYRQYFQHFFGNGTASERWALPLFRKLCQPLRQYAGWGT